MYRYPLVIWLYNVSQAIPLGAWMGVSSYKIPRWTWLLPDWGLVGQEPNHKAPSGSGPAPGGTDRCIFHCVPGQAGLLLDYDWQRLELGHRQFQGPQQRPRLGGLSLKTWMSMALSQSLGRWCWWQDHAKQDWRVHRGMAMFPGLSPGPRLLGLPPGCRLVFSNQPFLVLGSTWILQPPI